MSTNASSPYAQFEDIAVFYDELMDVVPYDFWADYVLTLFHFVGHQPKKVLDCACGTGNLTFELAKKGMDVFGVDLSAQMIAQAQAKATGVFFDLSTRFTTGNLTSFLLDESFDSATCLYDSLNYILTPSELEKAFAQIAAHVQKDGIFVFDFNSVFAFEANLFTQRSNAKNALHYDWKANFDRSTKICSVQMRFEKKMPDGTMHIFHELHQERAYSQCEIETLLANSGWELLHTFDAYTLNRPHQRSERWFFVARRK